MVACFAGAFLAFSAGTIGAQPAWPEITRECKLWTRWWWPGSTVNSNDLTVELEGLRKAGLGGVEITPIYGVAGCENRFVSYLSPQWMDLFGHTLKEATRLDLGVDMATGTGWPFGGPWVDSEDACKYVAFKTYTLKAGERLTEPVSFQQRTIVRAVGNQVYQLYGEILRAPGETTVGSMQSPQLRAGARRIDISELVEPISSNKNLQALALDQIRFPKPPPLQVLMAYSDKGKAVDITTKVGPDGFLKWTPPQGNWTLYAVFQGWHGKMVERAAPGGEGNVIDHFSRTAIRDYLGRFDRAFAWTDIEALRGFFNDSYEVDDASGQADWTPRLFAEFKKRRGYDLREHLPALFGKDSADKNARVLCDYRETISDLLLETFTSEWSRWSHGKNALVRNQAHGSPANILDLYAASDIPETEGTEILRIKSASSAAHVSGKRLTSSESATWLNEHFRSTLWDVKQNLDRYFLGGVNHVFYHGTCYSPQNEPWPGWLFYAAVHFNPRNPWWDDFTALNEYASRVQSFLQSGRPDNDVLLYFPISDSYSDRGNEMLRHFDGGVGRLAGEFRTVAETLQSRGYAFDFISDRQLQSVKVDEGNLISSGVSYKTVLVPQCRYMPLATLEKLMGLARAGATVTFFHGLPATVSGFADLDAKQRKFRKLLADAEFAPADRRNVRVASLGKGRFVLSDSLEQMLHAAGVERETMVDSGLQCIRRNYSGGRYYFVANRSDAAVNGWTALQTVANQVAIFDPMRHRSGYARVRKSNDGRLEVYVQLAPGESCVVQTLLSSSDAPATPVNYYEQVGAPQTIAGEWRLEFVSGGPELPPMVTLKNPVSWTELDSEPYRTFSGSAEYRIDFPKPAGDVAGWWLDLGEVRESARVGLNGRHLATLIGPPFRVFVTADSLREKNTLTVRVSNLMANRIADMDRRNVPWKKFYNVNFPARLAANRGTNGLFDASKWQPLPSGLIGPVTVTPVSEMKF
jgi:hypothetical protein